MTTNIGGGKKLISGDQVAARYNVVWRALDLTITANNKLTEELQNSPTLGQNDCLLLEKWSKALAEVMQAMHGELDRLSTRPDSRALN